MGEMLDLRVAQTLMRLRLIERALHGRGRWTMEYAGITVPVTSFVRGDRVSFVANFPAVCVMGDEPVLSVGLLYDGDLVWSIALEEALDEGGCQFWWDLALPDPVPVP